MAKRRTIKKKNKTPCTGGVVETPGITDVLLGRGGHVNHNAANQRYLELVSQRKEEYHNCMKTEKASIAWKIMSELRQQDPPSRFLKKDYSTGLWHVVDDADVRRKISQCLRERGVPVRPSAKGKPRKGDQARDQTSRLRSLLRTSRNVNTDSDDDEWLPESEEEAYSPAAISEESAKHVCAMTNDAPKHEDGASADTVDPAAMLAPLSLEEGAKILAPWGVIKRRVGGQVETAPIPNETFVLPPPMPQPMSLKQEESSRIWSDFFTRSFASSTPSIFDFSGSGENAWEDLLDPSILPVLTRSDDDDSFPESCNSDALTTQYRSESPTKRSYSQASRVYSQSITDPVPWAECLSLSKRQKKQPDKPDPNCCEVFGTKIVQRSGPKLAF